MSFRDHCAITTTDTTARVATDDRHENAGGTVHGGLMMTMLDSAMAEAVAAGLEEGQTTATADMSVTFLEPGHVGDQLVAEATVTKRGSSMVFVEGVVRSTESDEALARAIATFAVIDEEE